MKRKSSISLSNRINNLLKSMSDYELNKLDSLLMDVGNLSSCPRSQYNLRKYINLLSSIHGFDKPVTL